MVMGRAPRKGCLVCEHGAGFPFQLCTGRSKMFICFDLVITLLYDLSYKNNEVGMKIVWYKGFYCRAWYKEFGINIFTSIHMDG